MMMMCLRPAPRDPQLAHPRALSPPSGPPAMVELEFAWGRWRIRCGGYWLTRGRGQMWALIIRRSDQGYCLYPWILLGDPAVPYLDWMAVPLGDPYMLLP